MTDPVLTALIQVEVELHTLVIPGPSNLVVPVPVPVPTPPANTPEYDDWASRTDAYKGGTGQGTPELVAVGTLLTALYQIDFIRTLGSDTIPDLIGEVGTILFNIAETLGNLGPNVAAGVAGLTTFLNAVQRLPGSPEALATASEILTQITGLLGDIPSARNELYIIAQQLQTISDTFANA